MYSFVKHRGEASQWRYGAEAAHCVHVIITEDLEVCKLCMMARLSLSELMGRLRLVWAHDDLRCLSPKGAKAKHTHTSSDLSLGDWSLWSPNKDSAAGSMAERTRA
jgi:hypothetical protein